MRRFVTQRNLTVFAVVTSLFFVAIATMLVNSITLALCCRPGQRRY